MHDRGMALQPSSITAQSEYDPLHSTLLRLPCAAPGLDHTCICNASWSNAIGIASSDAPFDAGYLTTFVAVVSADADEGVPAAAAPSIVSYRPKSRLGSSLCYAQARKDSFGWHRSSMAIVAAGAYG
jgi:hypothetical protein